MNMFSCKNNAKPELIEDKYSNGQVKRKYYKINKLIQDTMWEYHNSGELKTIYLFKDGKQHGRTTRYYKTGELEEVQYFENGLQQRGDTVFYKNGRIRFTAEMKDDKKNGLFRRWSENKDSIELEQLFRHDTIIIYKVQEEQEIK
ncbi:MAG: hypothetical protein IPO62_02895 [Saprospiraceae bacterium]|nr:hypothetical protein [Saprospiraceae bacterium]